MGFPQILLVLKIQFINPDGSYTITDVYCRPNNKKMTYNVLTVTPSETIGKGGSTPQGEKNNCTSKSNASVLLSGKKVRLLMVHLTHAICVQQVLQKAGMNCNYNYVPNIMAQAEDSKMLTWATKDKNALTNAKGAI